MMPDERGQLIWPLALSLLLESLPLSTCATPIKAVTRVDLR